jgi:hypothetical protein
MGGRSDSPQWRSRLADIFFRGSKNKEVKSDSDSDITLVSRYVSYLGAIRFQTVIETFY